MEWTYIICIASLYKSNRGKRMQHIIHIASLVNYVCCPHNDKTSKAALLAVYTAMSPKGHPWSFITMTIGRSNAILMTSHRVYLCRSDSSQVPIIRPREVDLALNKGLLAIISETYIGYISSLYFNVVIRIYMNRFTRFFIALPT